MRKFIAVFAAILLIALIGGCGNVQQESKKTLKIPVSTEVPHVSLPVATSSNLKQDDNEEEEFRTKGKLKTKKTRVGAYKYIYSVLDDGTVWLKKILFVKSEKVKVVKIPSQIKGRDVTVLGHAHGSGLYDVYEDEDVNYDTNIFGVMCDESFGTRFPKEIYRKTKSIERIVLPSTIKVLGRDSFEYLPQYKVLDIGGCAAKNVDFVSMSYGWSTIKVSKLNPKYKTYKKMLLSKDGKVLFKAFGMCNKLVIPEGVETIKSEAFLSIKTKKLFIPSSVREMEINPTCNYIEDVSISKDNEVFGKLKKSIYKKKNMELVLLCNNKQEIIIPEGIKKVKDFCYNKYCTGGTGRYDDEFGSAPNVEKMECPKTIESFDCSLYFSETAKIVFKSKKCPKMEYPSWYSGFVGESKLKIYVPQGCKKEYKKKLREHIGAKDKIIVY